MTHCINSIKNIGPQERLTLLFLIFLPVDISWFPVAHIQNGTTEIGNVSIKEIVSANEC
jgi:hypothetical protein